MKEKNYFILTLHLPNSVHCLRGLWCVDKFSSEIDTTSRKNGETFFFSFRLLMIYLRLNDDFM